MKVVIIDDEVFARQNIISVLNIEFPHVQVVGEAGSVEIAVDVITNTSPDLVFLDIDLLDGSGFDVLNQLTNIKFKVIFVTAHQEFALKAIKFSALDYILKPVSAHELVSAVNKMISEVSPLDAKQSIDVLLANNKANNAVKKIVLKTSDCIHLVEVSNIIRCESDNNYTRFHLQGGEKIMMSKGLKEYDELLNDSGFLRVHQSHLINLNFINKYEKKDGGYLVLTDQSHIPVSQRKKQKILDYFNQLS